MLDWWGLGVLQLNKLTNTILADIPTKYMKTLVHLLATWLLTSPIIYVNIACLTKRKLIPDKLKSNGEKTFDMS